MESVPGNGFSFDLRTGPAAGLGKSKHSNSVNKVGSSSSSQDHFQFGNISSPPFIIITKPLPIAEHASATVQEKVHNPGTLEPELHWPFSDMQQGIGGMSNVDLSTYPTRSLAGNPFQVPPNTNNMESVGATQKVDEKYDPGNEWNGCDMRTYPSNTIGVEQGHESMASNISRTDPVANIGDAVGANSPAVNPGRNCESGTNQDSEMQNPPVQVMMRPEDTASTSLYKIPSHVFNRTNTNAPEWSTASNESLFSIHMGTLSFSRELTWFKSGELDKYGDMIMSGPPNSFQSNQSPGNKFNDMSQRTAEQDQGSRVTEAKAAETMREVIRENTERNGREELSVGDGTSHSKVLSSPSNQSGHSDVSPNSFSFKPLTGDGGKSKNGSSRRYEEKPKQQKHSGPLSPKETTNGAEALNSAAKTSNKRWLSCFACCPFCR